MRSRVVFGALVALALSPALLAQSTWTGAFGTSWDNANNWSPAGVPTSTTDVIIANTATQPSTYLLDPECDDLTIDAGATLTLGSGFELTVNGNVVINGTFTVSSGSSDMVVAGSWTNNGTFNNGSATVDLDGTGDIGGSSTTTFHDLVISSGTRSAITIFDVDGDCQVKAGSTLSLGTLTHTVAGNWTSSAAGATVSGTGTLEFDGNGLLTTLGNSLPNVLVSAGTRSVNTSAIAGDLEMTGGAIQILDGSTLSVSGNADLSAGTLGWTSSFPGTEALDVGGDVTITASAGSTSADAQLLCGGNWSSTSAFAPADGLVILDGAGSTTIGGASPTFASLQLAAGTKTFNSATTITGDLIQTAGVDSVLGAALDVGGGVALGASGSMDVGSSTHTVAGDWTSTGADATGTGSIDFDGTGSISTGTADLPNVVVSAGTRSLSSSTIAGTLDMTGGTLEVLDNQTIAVGSDTNLSGGSLSFVDTSAGAETIVFSGNFTATVAVTGATANTDIFVVGDWSSDATFDLGAGTVSLITGVSSIGGTAPVFPDLVIGADADLDVAATVEGDFSVLNGATLTSNAVLDVDGDVNLNSTGTWDLGAFTHTVAGDLVTTGGDATNAAGTIEFDGTGLLDCSPGVVTNVLISAGVRSVDDSLVSGDVSMTGGELSMLDNAVILVGGNLDLSAGTLTFNDSTAGFETIDVGGDVSIAALDGGTTANTRIFCAGNWTSDAAWAPTLGTVFLDGAGGTTVSGAGTTVADLDISNGTRTIMAPLTVTGDVDVADGAALDTDAAIDVAGDTTLGDATASWDLGSFTHTLAGSYTSSGADATGTGRIEMDGTGNLATGGGSIANLRVSAGTTTVLDADVTGALELTGGTLLISDDATLSVAGNADLTGGSLAFHPVAAFFSEVLDVEGDVTVAGASATTTTALSRIECAGNWSSDAGFVMGDGRVVLDGAGPLTVGGLGARFPDLEIASGDLSTTDALTVDAGFTLADGASLTSGHVVSVAGDVDLGNATASWDLGALTHPVTGSWDSNGAPITNGTIEFDGTGTLRAAGAGIDNVLISAGTRTALLVSVAGNLDMTGGTLLIDDDQFVSVGGNVDLSAGTLSFQDTTTGKELLLVSGDTSITCASGLQSANTLIRASGDWTSTASFALTQGEVRLEGAGANTVSGLGLTLPDVEISGTKQLLDACSVAGDLTVKDGATLDADAALTIAGNVALGASGTFDTGIDTHVVSGNWAATGGDAIGAGTIEFDASGNTGTGGGMLVNTVVSAGTRLFNSTLVSGTLDLTGGILRINNDATLQVTGDATLTGGAVEWFFFSTNGTPDVLDVDGNLTCTVPATTTVDSKLFCAGDFVGGGAFAPTSGLTTLDGLVATNVSGAGLTFFDLDVSGGTRTVLDAMSVGGDLDVASGAGLDTSAAAADIDGDVTLGDGTANWALGALTHTVGGDYVSAGATASGTGVLEFDGGGALATGGGTIPNVLVSAGLRAAGNTDIVTDLDMTGGELRVGNGATVTVGGDATFTGSTFGFDTTEGVADDILDVEGALSIDATAGGTTDGSFVFCAGDFTATATFAPALGTVVLDGGTSASVSAPTLSSLQVDSGTKTLTTALALNGDLDVLDGATFDCDAATTIDGSVSLGDGTASWDIGADTHVIDGDLLSTGASASGTGLIELASAGTLTTATGSIANLLISGGVRTVLDTTVLGDLTVTSGIVQIEDDVTFAVGGNADLQAGLLGFFPTAQGADDVFDVEGDVTCTMSSVTSSANTVFRVGGNWSSNGSYAPAAGTIELDGAGATTITGLAPDFAPSFNDLVLTGNTRSAAGDLEIIASSITIDAGAGLDVGANTVGIPASSVLVNGDLSVDAGGVLQLGAGSAVLVSSLGMLSLVGTDGDEATIEGHSGGGYLLNIDGTLEAGFFKFSDMGPFGIQVNAAATIAAFPNDMRDGTFTKPSASPGSVMLAITRPAPTEFRYVNFNDPGGVGTSNVSTVSGAAITFANSGGGLAGEGFDVDPFNLVNWIDDSTKANFTATAGLDMVTLDWTTTLEVDAVDFHVDRALSPAGPYTRIDTQSAAGPGAYQFIDATAVGGTTYTYQLVQTTTHNADQVLAAATTTPWSSELPPNMGTVGASGDFPDIQTGITGLAGQFNPTLMVETGTYAAFSVGTGIVGTLRIIPDGSGPVTIDTTAGPVTITGLNAFESVELHDMTIGDAGTTQSAVVVTNCDGLVVLDELVMTGGTGMPALRATNSTKVASQRSDLTGSPGILAETSTTLIASKGSLTDITVTGMSNVRLCEMVPGSQTVTPGSTLTSYGGIMADVDMPEFASLGTNVNITLSGNPGGLTFFFLSLGTGWQDITGPLWEMVGILDFTFFSVLLTLPMPGTGTLTFPLPLPPDGALIGFPINFGSAVVTGGVRRWSNSAPLIAIP